MTYNNDAVSGLVEEGVSEQVMIYELQFTRAGSWHRVTKEEWVSAERACGFYNPRDHWSEEPATGGFGNGCMSGRIRTAKAEG